MKDNNCPINLGQTGKTGKNLVSIVLYSLWSDNGSKCPCNRF